MKSIDRLRKYGARFNNSHDAWSGIGTEILEFADEIEHDVDDMWHALTIDAKPMTDENMAKSGWVRLPVDADGVPIHVGDVMELAGGDVEKVESLHNYGSEGWSATTTHNATVIPWSTRHHHAPTVEDVLREFYVLAVRGKEAHAEDVDADVLTEYAAKLRLAGEE